MVKANTKGDYTRTKRHKHPWQMGDEEHLKQIIWKEVAKCKFQVIYPHFDST
jgi:hypothetical protein